MSRHGTRDAAYTEAPASRYAREVDALRDSLAIVERERDAFRARLAAVEALADEWNTDWKKDRLERRRAAALVRAALAADPADTGR